MKEADEEHDLCGECVAVGDVQSLDASFQRHCQTYYEGHESASDDFYAVWLKVEIKGLVLSEESKTKQPHVYFDSPT